MAVTLPNCHKCMHYHITHDPAKPYGCRAMRFKSSRNPAQVVYATSGIVCQLFSLRVREDGDGKGGKGI